MNFKDLFGYSNKNVVITGAASGMAQAAAQLLVELGANVYALDLNSVSTPVKQSFKVDMSNKEEIDAVIEQLPNKIDTIFSCHGVAGWPGKDVLVTKINFISQRYLAEQLLPRVSENGSINFIASDAGNDWQNNWDKLNELFATETFEAAVEWVEENADYIDQHDAYALSKKALVGYVKSKVWAPEFAARRIRINCISPGFTNTGLTKDFTEVAGHAAHKHGMQMDGLTLIETMYLNNWNGRPATPEEMGYPLVFLGSAMASYISGVNLNINFGKDAFSDIKTLNDTLVNN